MGKGRTAAWRGRVAQAAAGRQTMIAEQSRRDQEARLQFGERYLGSEEQLSGNIPGAVGGAGAAYSARYSLDPGMAASLSERWGTNRTALQQNESEANSLMEQAQAAAESGDLGTAERLRQQADSLLTRGVQHITNTEDIRSAFTMRQNAGALAASDLGSPVGMLVGQQVAEARAFQDPNSEASQRQINVLADPARRALAAGQRENLREIRQIGLRSGGARSPYAEAAISSRAQESFATQRAQVEAEAVQTFESFKRDYGQSVAQLAQAYLQNQSGIREQFQASIDRLRTVGAQTALTSAQMFGAEAAEARARHAARKNARKELAVKGVGMVIGATLGYIGGGLPGLAAGALGQMKGGGKSAAGGTSQGMEG